MKGILYLISFNILFASFVLKAEEITLESLHTTEGAVLTCTEEQINLRIYGETFRSEIIVTKRKDIAEVLSNTKYYNIPIGYIDENLKSEVVFTVEKKYLVRNREIVSAISLDPIYKKDAYDDLSILFDAMNEVHKKKKCLSWNFE